ncbi:MAG: 4Fe-4S dicluster domain-containing protein [Candidatus Heimdallarchaeota archaeon]|nr:4Fe-4S dicluster domain-containing protein [Candidatus Heimdallarchaeota archaeon]
MGRKTKITIDYFKCGDGVGLDPRECSKCLRICEPAIFLLHETLGVEEENPYDPQIWRITPLYPSLCTRCLKCNEVCPVEAINVTW